MGTKIVNYSNKEIKIGLVCWKNYSNFVIVGFTWYMCYLVNSC